MIIGTENMPIVSIISLLMALFDCKTIKLHFKIGIKLLKSTKFIWLTVE